MLRYSLLLVLFLVACGRSSTPHIDAGADAGVDMTADAGIDMSNADAMADAMNFPDRVIVRGISGYFEMPCCDVLEVRPDRVLLDAPCGVWIILDGTFVFEGC